MRNVILILILLIPSLLNSSTVVSYYDTKISIEITSSVPKGLPILKKDLLLDLHKCSNIGKRFHPIYRVYTLHKGLDLPAKKGTPIYSMAYGKVIEAGRFFDGYGNKIIIKSGDYTVLYAHCDEIFVKEGDIISFQQKIGTVGMTGTATGPHIHLEVRKFNTLLDPIKVIDG